MTHQLVGAIFFEPDSPAAVAEVCAQLLTLSDDPVVVDNSTSDQAVALVREVCAQHGVELLGDGSNHGTAGGINRLLRTARERDRDWLTYFDQDSRVTGDYRARLDALDTVADDVAAVGSIFDDRTGPAYGAGPLEARRYLIASGTSWRVDAVIDAGWCDEGMFLDVVDIELCMRLRAAGRRIVVDPARLLEHHIGSDQVHLLGRVPTSRHPAWRRRLMWRNSVVLARRYARTFPAEVARHLAIRVVETVGGAVHYRSPRWLWWALRGLVDGLRAPRRLSRPT